jgi:polar amino acid transport system ATP-binding protein
MRLHLGLVFQSFNLFPQYTALTNVYLPLYLRAKERIKGETCFGRERREAYARALEEAKARAEEILTEVGLGDKMNNYPYQLSGGQQQRVAIARALALSPSVLCFDEPTSALDPELTGEVLKVIKDLRSEGRTMLIVTHEMEFAKNVADKVIFIADGEIEEEGAPEQIFNNPQKEKTKNFLIKSGE